MLANWPLARAVAAHHSIDAAVAMRSETVELAATVAIVATGHPEATVVRPYARTPAAVAVSSEAAMATLLATARLRARADQAV